MAKSCTTMVDVDRLYFADNVRSEACLQLSQMEESIRRHGFKANHPLVVSEKIEKVNGEEPIITYLVLIGNRRGLGLIRLRDTDKETYRSALVQAGKVPAIVHRGLTQEEEVDLRIDHSSDEDRVPLDEWSIFMAIKQLVRGGYDTQDRIAVKLGLYKTRGKEKGRPNRSYVQVRCNLARLPLFVQGEFEKLMVHGKDRTNVRFSHIHELYKVFNLEFVEYPDANGPEFQKVWVAAMAPREKADPKNLDGTTEAKELSPAEAVKRSQAASSRGLREALLVATRQSNGDFAKIDENIMQGEVAIAVLADIQDYLGEKDYADLLEASRKQAAEKAQPETSVEEPHEHVEA